MFRKAFGMPVDAAGLEAYVLEQKGLQLLVNKAVERITWKKGAKLQVAIGDELDVAAPGQFLQLGAA